MAANAHLRPNWRATTILAVLAIMELVGTSFLLTHHHHSDLAQNQHCAICVFASAHATPATGAQAFDVPLGFVTFVPEAPEQSLVYTYVCTHNQRGPPTA